MGLIARGTWPFHVLLAARPCTAIALVTVAGGSPERSLAVGIVADVVVWTVAAAALLPRLFPVHGPVSAREPPEVTWSHDGFDAVLPAEPVGDGDAPGPALIVAVLAAAGTAAVVGALLGHDAAVMIGMMATVPVALAQFVASWIAHTLALAAHRRPVPVAVRAGTLTVAGRSWRWTGDERVHVDLPHLTLRIDRPDGRITVSAERAGLLWLAERLAELRVGASGTSDAVPEDLARLRESDVERT